MTTIDPYPLFRYVHIYVLVPGISTGVSLDFLANYSSHGLDNATKVRMIIVIFLQRAVLRLQSARPKSYQSWQTACGTRLIGYGRHSFSINRMQYVPATKGQGKTYLARPEQA